MGSSRSLEHQLGIFKKELREMRGLIEVCPPPILKPLMPSEQLSEEEKKYLERKLKAWKHFLVRILLVGQQK